LLQRQQAFLDRFAGSGAFLEGAIAFLREVKWLHDRYGSWERTEEALRLSSGIRVESKDVEIKVLEGRREAAR
jgi:hypothetical protein